MKGKDLSSLIGGFINRNNLDPESSEGRGEAEKLLEKLDSRQTEKLKNLLSDPEKTKAVLNSPAAKNLFKRLSK